MGPGDGGAAVADRGEAAADVDVAGAVDGEGVTDRATTLELMDGRMATHTFYACRRERDRVRVTAEYRERLVRYYGLDQPLHIQYVKWLWSFIRGDFGYSFEYDLPVNAVVGDLGGNRERILAALAAARFVASVRSAEHRGPHGDRDALVDVETSRRLAAAMKGVCAAAATLLISPSSSTSGGLWSK